MVLKNSLLGCWDLEDETGKHSLSFKIPGDGITALQNEGLISDPYFGRNEYDVRWICDRDWIAKRAFEVTHTDLDLVVSELDTVSEIKINGITVLETENAFRTYRTSVSSALKTGHNEIEIRFKVVTKYANAKQDAQPYFVPDMKKMCPIHNGNMVRKPQCDFGWDWNIALAPFGLFGDIYLEPSNAVRLENFQLKQTHSKGSATVEISVAIKNHSESNAQCVFSLNGQNVTGVYDAATGSAGATFTVENPKLWWPAGQGKQNLYDVVVTLGDAKLEKRIGLCDIKLVSEPDEVGRSFRFEVNGRAIFAKGANWIPADALAGRINQDDVRELLQSAVDANMNMIRIWGGGRYEPDWFYDLCDELGLMIWHDLMFSCNLYSATDEFLAEIEQEVKEAVLRIDYHASLALWCGDNELLGALTWFEEAVKDRDRYLVGYDRLNRAIEKQVKENAPHSNWWPSSPSPGPMSFGDTWHDDTSGDMHFWSVWHEGRDFDHYRDVSPRFCSEFGFQSYPSMNVIRQFAEDEDLNIASPVMESHQKDKGGNARIAETMFRYFRFPNSFENFVYLSQVQQGLAIKTAVTHWRSLKPHSMGALIWQLNDTWPVCSWASLNYGGDWKLLHHMEKRFFTPLLISAVPIDDKVILRASNDLPQASKAELEVFALSMSGEQRALATKTIEVGIEQAIDVVEISKADIGDDILVYRWNDDQGTMMQDHLALQPYKGYALPDPNISFDVGEKDGAFHLTLKADKPAFYVSIEADVSGRFSDNGFLMTSKEDVVITFAPKNNGARPNFVIRDLRNATL
ncbi:MAG: glycoside hydrolase family 2 protein [Rhizobiaceae bacterium]|nr:glycoside hydrolase family 2 protein [Rhizobiaceae bacterium]